jgi:peptide-methionine (S)-S-oxide reductase
LIKADIYRNWLYSSNMLSNFKLTGRQGVVLGASLLLTIAIAYGINQTIFAGRPVNSTNAMKRQLNPSIDIPPKTTGEQTIVLAGGCFWGVEGVFEKLQGVSNVVSGYAGGKEDTANYQAVSNGTTGHAEAVQVTYDPQKISFGQLLKIFFIVAHDPTQIDRQWPDQGTQYRSEIFVSDPEQQRVAQAYIDQLSRSKTFDQPIATKLTTLTKFYPAEEYHQNFMAQNPNYPYILMHDRPKVDRLQQEFPELVKN